MPRPKKYRGGQNAGPIGTNSSKIITKFLQDFGATANMTPNQIKNKFSAHLAQEITAGTTNNAVRNALTKYVNNIFQIEQSLIAKQNSLIQQQANLQQQQANLQKQKNIESSYRGLIKNTNAIINKFNKYLLKQMSFITTNPRKDRLLLDLYQRMRKLVNKYDFDIANQYTQQTTNRTKDIQNKLMIDVIQALIENARPIYQEMKNNLAPINTNVPNQGSRKILQAIANQRSTTSALQKEFSNTISNWVDLLTEVIQLNAVTLAPINSTVTANNKLGELHLEYQESQKKILDLLTDAPNVNKSANIFRHPRMKSEVFIQELVSEIFRYGMTIFRMYKHNQLSEPSPA